MGVIGMSLSDGDEVIGMQMESQGSSLMIVSEKGLGKCTNIDEFSTQNRGGKGVKCYKITEKTGNIVGVKSVNIDDEIMLITTEGIIIRIKVSSTALLRRITSGVKLINLDENVTVASIAKVRRDKSLDENVDDIEHVEEKVSETAEETEQSQEEGKQFPEDINEALMDQLIQRAKEDGEQSF
ncbi:MAG: DNA gyrase subunit A, partial [Lachnospiraceae bacterium]|nr:DNA gyrase subunit A [Lachnospiraceae bacterium]